MVEYFELNMNPKNRKTGDCSVRALAGLLSMSWEGALRWRYEVALKTGYDPTSKEVTEAILIRCGFTKMKEPKKIDSTGKKRKYMVKELDKLLTKKQLETGVYIAVNHHDTCIKNNKIIDIWNCGNQYVRNYWVKEV